MLPESRIYAVKKQLTDTSLKEKTTIHPIFLSLQKLTNDPMCVTESHWLKNQQCIVYRFQSGLCPCAAFTWTWRWTCGATSTAGENLTYKVKSRPFKFHDSITSRSVSQMSANLSGVEFKIIVSNSEKDKENCCLVFSPPPPRAINPRRPPPLHVWKWRCSPLMVRRAVSRRSHEKIVDCEQSRSYTSYNDAKETRKNWTWYRV